LKFSGNLQQSKHQKQRGGQWKEGIEWYEVGLLLQYGMAFSHEKDFIRNTCENFGIKVKFGL